MENHQKEGLSKLDGEHPDARMQRALAWVLAARSIVAGGGVVRNGTYYLSQKLPTVKTWSKYGHTSSLFRLNAESGPRLEIRCSDDTLCDRATLLRYAYMDFALAGGLLDALDVETHSSDDAFFEDLAASQIVNFDERGRICPSDYLERHRMILQKVAQLALDFCEKHDPSPEYGWAASELQKTADQFGTTMSGREDVSALAANGIDWALKATAIHRELMRRDYPVPANQPDEKSNGLDLAYDAIRVQKDGTVKRGWGYRLRHVGARPISTERIRHARHNPPTTTRAYDRATYIRQGVRSVRDWGMIEFDRGEPYINHSPSRRLVY